MLVKVFKSPAGPVTNTTPTSTNKTTLNTTITFLAPSPKYIPTSSDADTPLFLSDK